MKYITRQHIDALITGSTFFGTGGGGNPKEAVKIYENIFQHTSSIQLATIEEFPDDALFVTAFSVGSVSQDEDSTQAIKKAFQYLSSHLGKEVAGIIPVEIGAHSVATACYLSSVLGIPVLDADIVGGRSTPEVFLETITLFNIPRTPSAVVNTQGDASLLLTSSGFQKEEAFFRNFATMASSDAHVVGYPMIKQQVQHSIEHGTVSRAWSVGKLLNAQQLNEVLENTAGRLLFSGTITRIREEQELGFTKLTVLLKGSQGEAKLFIKNENLILWINNTVVLTCPDLIILLNKKQAPIYNGELEEEMAVCVLGVPALSLWRSEAGQKLFNPRTFGFDFEPILLL